MITKKQKNSFSKLRKQFRSTESKLNIANNTIKLQIDEIVRLNRALDLNEKQVHNLNSSLLAENKQKNRLKARLMANKQLKDNIYKSYMKDLKKKNDDIFILQVVIFLIGFMTVITSLIIAFRG